MNFLFMAGTSMAHALLTVVTAYIVFKCISVAVKGKLPPMKIPMIVTFILLSVIGMVNKINTYGPRLEVQKAHIPTAPQTVTVEKALPFIEPVDRRGMGDERINNEPIE